MFGGSSLVKSSELLQVLIPVNAQWARRVRLTRRKVGLSSTWARSQLRDKMRSRSALKARTEERVLWRSRQLLSVRDRA